MSEPFATLDLQRQLLNDLNGTFRADIENDLRTWRRSLKRDLDGGVSRERFQELNALIIAIDAAAAVVAAIWSEYRRREA
ncbi:EscE/YscE/SsaE family type III secretion system needle protein co-chaperone [Bradyrhizobium sp. 62B]|uniref:EscE/YscE/SsaE family type III secretion system needle protein co-chaperone n=1 Tax=Bradyrhizobium sp. 62B TaxID=2898442 RepID=UPI0035E14514